MRASSTSMEVLYEDARHLIRENRTDFLEIRLEKRGIVEIVQTGRQLHNYINHIEQGGYVRVISNGKWGCSSFSGKQSIKDAVKRANILADSALSGGVILAELKPLVEVFEPPSIEPLFTVPFREKAFLCRRYSELLASSISGLSTRVHYRELDRQKRVFNSLGTDVFERESICGIHLEAVGGKHATIVSRDLSHRGGFEFIRHRENLIGEMIENLSLRDTESTIQPGVYPVIIDPRLSGILIHESFGHLSEADFHLGNPVVGDLVKRGRKIGIDQLKIVDDSTHFDKPGSYAFDDEGIPGGRTVLVKGGEIKDRLLSLETAGRFNTGSTGNARAFDFRFPPMVRMSCTYVEPADHSLDDLLSMMGDGLYLRGSLGGATNMDWFSFTAEEAFVVRRGKVGKPLKPVTISGRVFNVLGSIRGIGNDLILRGSTGGCSKGEQRFLPVSHGGPHLFLDSIYAG